MSAIVILDKKRWTIIIIIIIITLIVSCETSFDVKSLAFLNFPESQATEPTPPENDRRTLN